jgi:putative membrane protein
MFSIVVNALVLIVGLLHVYFMILEIFLWTKPIGLRIFKMNYELAEKTKTLASNQGLYNGFLAAGIFWGVLQPDPALAFQIKIFFFYV